MLQAWMWPSWSGDWRILPDGEKASKLIVVDPTPAEVDRLGVFLKVARKKGWVEQHLGIVLKGKVEIPVAAPLQKAGRILLGNKPKGVLTAVRSVNGKVSSVLAEPGKEAEAAEKVDAAVEDEKADVATTVRRPTLCCPVPVPGPDQRASEVLQAFCTPQQWADWTSEGILRCYGSLSGRPYEVLHRHHPLAIERTKIVWDVIGGHIMHCYDWSVPPAEEALVMKLTLEHAEHWIRNPSGMYLNVDDEPIYTDPFMSEERQGADGIEDAAFMRGLGVGLAGMAAETPVKEN